MGTFSRFQVGLFSSSLALMLFPLLRQAVPAGEPQRAASSLPAMKVITHLQVPPLGTPVTLPAITRNLDAGTLLDERAYLRDRITPAQLAAWTNESHRGATKARESRLQLMLGEYDLGTQEPRRAEVRFRKTAANTPLRSANHGLALYDLGLTLLHEGRYGEAKHELNALLTSKAYGYDHHAALLFSRHAAARATYHARHLAMGIPQPASLDPLCGISSLAVCLRGHGMAINRDSITKKVHFNGEGSSMRDLEEALPKLGLTGRVVYPTEKGLRNLPKPAIAHVENDHFVAITRADSRGVAYVCSDCGAWPGGEIHLSWPQWRAMNTDEVLATARPGSAEDIALQHLPTEVNGHPKEITLASAHPQNLGVIVEAQRALRAMGSSVVASNNYPYTPSTTCGLPGSAPKDPPFAPDPAFGDPINAATGEMDYQPAPDLTIYNPIGPNVSWSRTYQPLSNLSPTGLGVGWSHSYNWRIERSNISGSWHTFLRMNTGATIALTPTAGELSPPTSGSPVKAAAFPLGTPFTVDWNYDPSQYFYRITFTDGYTWTFAQETTLPVNGGGQYTFYYPVKIQDRIGNYIQLSWSTWPSPNTPDPVTDYTTSQHLQAITDSTGKVLLQVYYYNNDLASVVEPPPLPGDHARGVAYWIYAESTHSTYVAKDLEAVSAITDLTPDPYGNYTWGAIPMRNWFGYAQISTGNPYAPGGYETAPVMVWRSSPAPNMFDHTTGAVYGGYTSLTIIDYDTYGAFWRLTDSLGNKTIMDPVLGTGGTLDASRITIQDASGNIAFRYYSYWDSLMRETKRKLVTSISGGAETTITPGVSSYSDPMDPNHPSSATDAYGATSLFQWDRFGNPVSSTTPKGTVTNRTWSYTSFPLGQLTSKQVGSKTANGISYFPNGRIQYVYNPIPGQSSTGSVQTTTVGSLTTLGNISSTSFPGNSTSATHTISFGYTTDGSYTQSEALGKPITATDSLGHVSHCRYDHEGRPITFQDADGNINQIEYNTANQPVRIWSQATGTSGSGQSSKTYAYLYPGGPLTITRRFDESGVMVGEQIATYDSEGELLTSTGTSDPFSVTYDAAHRIKTLTTGRAADFSKTTTYNYDLAGRVTSITLPLGTGTSGADTQNYTYDDLSRPLTRTDGNGLITHFSYSDADGLLTDIVYGSGSSNDVHYAYDIYDRLTSTTDGAGQYSYTYDDCNNVLTNTQTYTGVPAQTLTYTYNPDGSHKKLTPTGITATTYSYDAAGRYTGLTGAAGTTSVSYSDGDRQLVKGLPNGLSTRIIYQGINNAMGVLTTLANDGVSATPRSSFGSFSYNGAKEVTGFASSVSGFSTHTGTTSYTYNANLDHLTQESSTRVGGYSNTLTFDNGGNSTIYRGASRTFNADDQFTSLTYDGNGNPSATLGSLPIVYDQENRAIQIGTVTAGYRSDGLRAWKQVGTKLVYFVYDGTKPIKEIKPDGSANAVNCFGQEGLVGRKTGGTWKYYQFDPQGNVSEISDASGNIIESRTYDAFGVENRVAATGNSLGTDPFGFNAESGYYLDRESGLYYCHFRYYDPASGGWVNRDPIAYGGGLNTYSYCSNQPIFARDPSGLTEFCGFDFTVNGVLTGLATGSNAMWQGLSNGIFGSHAFDNCAGADQARWGGTIAQQAVLGAASGGAGNWGAAAGAGAKGMAGAEAAAGAARGANALAKGIGAIEAGGKADIALGIDKFGLQEFADKIGAQHLMDDPEWYNTFLNHLENDTANFHLSTEGFEGNNVMEMLENQVNNYGEGGTAWEIEQLLFSGKMGQVKIYVDDVIVNNPWAR